MYAHDCICICRYVVPIELSIGTQKYRCVAHTRTFVYAHTPTCASICQFVCPPSGFTRAILRCLVLCQLVRQVRCLRVDAPEWRYELVHSWCGIWGVDLAHLGTLCRATVQEHLQPRILLDPWYWRWETHGTSQQSKSGNLTQAALKWCVAWDFQAMDSLKDHQYSSAYHQPVTFHPSGSQLTSSETLWPSFRCQYTYYPIVI